MGASLPTILARSRLFLGSLLILAGVFWDLVYCPPPTVETLRCECSDSGPRLPLGMDWVISFEMGASACTLILNLPMIDPDVLSRTRRCASSKHLQTRRFLSTLESYLIDVQKMILHIYRQANERPAPFVDHTGTLRDAKTGEPIMAISGDDDEEDDGEDLSE